MRWFRAGRIKLTDEAKSDILANENMRPDDRYGVLFGRHIADTKDVIIDSASLGIDQEKIDRRWAESDGTDNWIGLWAIADSESISSQMRRYFTECKLAKFPDKSLFMVVLQQDEWSVAEWYHDEPNPSFLRVDSR